MKKRPMLTQAIIFGAFFAFVIGMFVWTFLNLGKN